MSDYNQLEAKLEPPEEAPPLDECEWCGREFHDGDECFEIVTYTNHKKTAVVRVCPSCINDCKITYDAPEKEDED
jgi:hypothetical protein